MNILKHFALWVKVPIEEVTYKEIQEYIGYLLDKRLKPKTINCHLVCIRGYYDYLYHEEGLRITNPVKERCSLRLSKPLPRHLKEEEIDTLFDAIKNRRDRAMFRVMLRCGLRVEEVANLTIGAIDLKRRRIFVYNGKGGKDRMVYISNDAYHALANYLKIRSTSKVKKVFLVEKGVYKGKPISVRGIQKRIEYYARKTGLKVSCHRLRHTMATQLLNAEAQLVTIQDLLGHHCITTTQRYSNVSNLKVQRDYYKAMAIVMRKAQKTGRKPYTEDFLKKIIKDLDKHKVFRQIYSI